MHYLHQIHNNTHNTWHGRYSSTTQYFLPDTIHSRGKYLQHYSVLYSTQYTARFVITTLHCIVPDTIPHTIHGTVSTYNATLYYTERFVITALHCIVPDTISDTIHCTVCNHDTTLYCTRHNSPHNTWHGKYSKLLCTVPDTIHGRVSTYNTILYYTRHDTWHAKLK